MLTLSQGPPSPPACLASYHSVPETRRYIVPCTPQIVSDLRTLRELATALLRYDCVTFLTLLDTLRLSEGRNSVWLFHPAAHTIFQEVGTRPALH